MTQENGSLEGDIQYEDIVTEEPERDLELNYEGGSITEEEESSGTESDFKALVKELRPKLANDRLNELLKTAGVSRIFPDNFLDKFGVMVAMLVMEENTTGTFQFVDMINHIQDTLSVGYEGRGIADLLEAFGAVKEEELDKLSKDLGL